MKGEMKVIKKWKEFFKLSKKEKENSRIERGEFFNHCMKEATPEQLNEYQQILEKRIIKRVGKQEYSDMVNTMTNSVIEKFTEITNQRNKN
jgi:hypothetical protein